MATVSLLQILVPALLLYPGVVSTSGVTTVLRRLLNIEEAVSEPCVLPNTQNACTWVPETCTACGGTCVVNQQLAMRTWDFEASRLEVELMAICAGARDIRMQLDQLPSQSSVPTTVQETSRRLQSTTEQDGATLRRLLQAPGQEVEQLGCLKEDQIEQLGSILMAAASVTDVDAMLEMLSKCSDIILTEDDVAALGVIQDKGGLERTDLVVGTPFCWADSLLPSDMVARMERAASCNKPVPEASDQCLKYTSPSSDCIVTTLSSITVPVDEARAFADQLASVESACKATQSEALCTPLVPEAFDALNTTSDRLKATICEQNSDLASCKENQELQSSVEPILRISCSVLIVMGLTLLY